MLFNAEISNCKLYSLPFILLISCTCFKCKEKTDEKNGIYSRTMSRSIHIRAYTFHSEFQFILAHNFVYLHGDCGIRVVAAK